MLCQISCDERVQVVKVPMVATQLPILGRLQKWWEHLPVLWKRMLKPPSRTQTPNFPYF